MLMIDFIRELYKKLVKMENINKGKPFCLICLAVNTEFIPNNEKTMNLYRGLITELPISINTHLFQFCIDCGLLLHKFQNLKTTAKDSIIMVEQILKNRSPPDGSQLDVKPVVSELMTQTQKAHTFEQFNPGTSSMQVVARIEPELTNNAHEQSASPDYDLTIRAKRITRRRTIAHTEDKKISARSKPKVPKWRLKYADVLKKQPTVILQRLTFPSTSGSTKSPQTILESPSNSSLRFSSLTLTDNGAKPPKSYHYCNACKITVLEPFKKHVLQVHFDFGTGFWICTICYFYFQSTDTAVEHFEGHNNALSLDNDLLSDEELQHMSIPILNTNY